MRFSMSKWTKTRFLAGASSRTWLGSLRRSPDPLDGCGGEYPFHSPTVRRLWHLDLEASILGVSGALIDSTTTSFSIT